MILNITPNDFMKFNIEESEKLAEEYATKKVQRDFEQGWQGIEYKLNTVGSSRGDYPFVTMTIGLSTDKYGKMEAITLLNVHKEGQGKKGFKRPVLFPKIVFLYDKNLHGDGSDKYPCADVFNVALISVKIVRILKHGMKIVVFHLTNQQNKNYLES